jgi:hypothetical protein
VATPSDDAAARRAAVLLPARLMIVTARAAPDRADLRADTGGLLLVLLAAAGDARKGRRLAMRRLAGVRSLRAASLLFAFLLLAAACGGAAEASSSAEHPSKPVAATLPTVPGTSCTVFPRNNVWNTPINNLPVDPRSREWLKNLRRGPGKFLSYNFGPGIAPSGRSNGKQYGFPFQVVSNATKLVHVRLSDPSESDPGPYPFGKHTPIEPYDGGDAHALMINKDTCVLYELYDAHWDHGHPRAGNGAIFRLRSNDLIYDRSYPLASDDDAGLPIYPGLVNYAQVKAGRIDHALRFDASEAYSGGHLWPATYTPTYLHNNNPNDIWMGSRWRLKASFNISHFSRSAQVILTALKTYGMFMSDIGSPSWTIDGTLNSRWPLSLVKELQTVPSTEFQAVNESSLMVSPDSGRVRNLPRTARAGSGSPSPRVRLAGTVTVSPGMQRWPGNRANRPVPQADGRRLDTSRAVATTTRPCAPGRPVGSPSPRSRAPPSASSRHKAHAVLPQCVADRLGGGAQLAYQRRLWILTMAAVAALTVREMRALWPAGRAFHVPCQPVSPVMTAPPSVALAPAASLRWPLAKVMTCARWGPGLDGRIVTVASAAFSLCVLLMIVT